MTISTTSPSEPTGQLLIKPFPERIRKKIVKRLEKFFSKHEDMLLRDDFRLTNKQLADTCFLLAGVLIILGMGFMSGELDNDTNFDEMEDILKDVEKRWKMRKTINVQKHI